MEKEGGFERIIKQKLLREDEGEKIIRDFFKRILLDGCKYVRREVRDNNLFLYIRDKSSTEQKILFAKSRENSKKKVYDIKPLHPYLPKKNVFARKPNTEIREKLISFIGKNAESLWSVAQERLEELLTKKLSTKNDVVGYFAETKVQEALTKCAKLFNECSGKVSPCVRKEQYKEHITFVLMNMLSALRRVSSENAVNEVIERLLLMLKDLWDRHEESTTRNIIDCKPGYTFGWILRFLDMVVVLGEKIGDIENNAKVKIVNA